MQLHVHLQRIYQGLWERMGGWRGSAQELGRFLSKQGGLDLSSWGRGGAKTVEDLLEEVRVGETTLTEDGPLSLEGRGYPPVPKLPGFHSNQENARPRPQNLRFVNGIPGNYGDVRTRP